MLVMDETFLHIVGLFIYINKDREKGSQIWPPCLSLDIQRGRQLRRRYQEFLTRKLMIWLQPKTILQPSPIGKRSETSK